MDADGALIAPELAARLHALDPFFGGPNGDVPSGIQPFLDTLSDLRQRLWCDERRTTFLGALKAGKSSLVNALIGANVLPVRANRATGVVSAVGYGPQWSARILRSGPDGSVEDVIQLAQVRDVALLDLSGPLPSPPEGIEEVRITGPVPWLEERLVLVDTPGLLEDEALAGRSYEALERSDLAVLVLSADKILSSREREVARRLNDLLHGNIVYILNRIDLIDEGDREEVLVWARSALKGSGNRLVGKACIFTTAAEGAMEESVASQGVSAFRRWLAALWSTPIGDRVAVLSRLGILEQHLCSLDALLRAELTAVRSALEQVRQEGSQALERERAGIVAHIHAGCAGLHLCKDGLPAHGEAFVAACTERARLQMGRADEPALPMRALLEAALSQYVDRVTAEVQEAISDLPVSVPPFELTGWILRGEVNPVVSPATEISTRFGDLVTRAIDGGSAGREAGATVGSWISKNVLGLDAERETLRRVEQVARGTVPALQREAERYIARVEQLLTDAEGFYRGWTRTSGRIMAAEETERSYSRAIDWCEAFLQEVRAIEIEIEG